MLATARRSAVAAALAGVSLGATALGATALRVTALPAAGASPPPAACFGSSSGPGPAVNSFWLATTTGSVYAFDNAATLHGAGNFTGTLADVVPDLSYTGGLTPQLGSTQGYWMVGTAGQVVARGIAATYPPATPGARPAGPVSDLTATANGKGYWVVSADGDVTAYGDARPFGVGHDPATGPGHVVRLVATPDGRGYWLLSADGQVQGFGDATAYGPRPGSGPTGQVVDLASTADGKGYWELTSTGSIYSFGDAHYYGAHPLAAATDPAEKLVADAAGTGYWIEDQNGTSWAFGSAVHAGCGAFDDPFNPVGSPPLEALVVRPVTVGDKAVLFALSQLGKPYRLGGTGPANYDCSGLVYRSYLSVTGKALPRTAADQYHAGGTHVPWTGLQTGDILFSSSNPANWQDIGTDALYVGGGALVEADVPAVQTWSVQSWAPPSKSGLMAEGVHPSP